MTISEQNRGIILVWFKSSQTKKLYLSVSEAFHLSELIFDTIFVHFDHENGLSPNKIVFLEFLFINSQISVILHILFSFGTEQKK
jgi:hypothetical protein